MCSVSYLFLYLFLVISARPIISTSTERIFAKFSELVELWLQINDLKLVVFQSPQRDIAMATNSVSLISIVQLPLLCVGRVLNF